MLYQPNTNDLVISQISHLSEGFFLAQVQVRRSRHAILSDVLLGQFVANNPVNAVQLLLLKNVGENVKISQYA
jgi:hypothetical protein